MEAVGTHDKIKFALPPRVNSTDAIFAFPQAVNFISKNYFRAILDFFNQQMRQRATRNCYITAAGQFQKDASPQTLIRLPRPLTIRISRMW